MVVLIEIHVLENGSRNGRVPQVATFMILHLRATEIFRKLNFKMCSYNSG